MPKGPPISLSVQAFFPPVETPVPVPVGPFTLVSNYFSSGKALKPGVPFIIHGLTHDALDQPPVSFPSDRRRRGALSNPCC